jgi:hypothetical protein
MADKATKRLLTNGWLYLPAVAGPIGGGLIKVGGGNVWAAVVVGVAPYAICALAYSVFLIGYLTALVRYVWSGPDAQESMERLITISVNSVVGILTLTRVTLPSPKPSRTHAPPYEAVGRRQA